MGWRKAALLPSETVRNAAEDEITTLLPPDASKRSTKARCARSDQMSAAAVMLPLALTGSRRAGRPAVRRQAETGGGGGGGGGDAKRSRCNVSAVLVSAGLSACRAEQSASSLLQPYI